MIIQISDTCAKTALRGAITAMANPHITQQTRAELDAAQMEIQRAYAAADRRELRYAAWRSWWNNPGQYMAAMVLAVIVLVALAVRPWEQ